MPTIPALTSFTANTRIKAAEVNANFSSIRTTVNTYGALQDAAATITGAWTFSTAPVFTNAQTFGAAVTVTTGGLTVSGGGITVTGNSTITGTLGGLTGLTVASGGLTVTAGASSFGAAVGVTGTVTATTFSGSGASLTNLPAANLTGTIAAISGANLTSLNATNISSGTLNTGRLPSTISGITTVSASQFTGTGAGAGTLFLEDGQTDFLSLPTGCDFQVTNNGSPNNYTATGPTGLTLYDGGQSDRFVKVLYNSVQYYLRLERWT
jgi:hypothetical protein